MYDIHGNLDALAAVVNDARAGGAAHFVLGGDYAMLGPAPLDTVKLLDTLPVALKLRGNTERWVARLDADDIPGDAIREACRHVADALGPERVAGLATLPVTAELEGVTFAHASPASDMRGFFDAPAEGEEQLVRGVGTRQLVVGHTHMQFRRPVGGVEVINPGSVGFPLDGDPRAAYALRHDDGEIELRRVEYDCEPAAARLEAIGTEWALLAARRLRTARP